MKRILITGAAGRIGSVLAEKLEEDYELVLLDRGPLADERSHTVDLSSRDETSEFFQNIGSVDYVIHLAADSRVDAPWNSVLENNILATYNVFEASKRKRVEKIVFASSNHVTGFYEKEPRFEKKIYEGEGDAMVSPEDEDRPDSLYGLSKAFGEQLGRYYSEKHGISTICLRIGTFREADRPLEERHLATWISHRDLSNLVKRSLEAKVDFGIYYGVSDNERRIWDISNAEEELGYVPKDSAEERLERDD